MIRKLSATVICRSKTKSILLCSLVCLVTFFAIMGTSLFYSSQNLLKQADEQYTTISVVEYTAGGYPDETVWNSQTLENLSKVDESVLKNQDQVKEYYTQAHLLGYVDDVHLSSFAFKAPYSNCAVIVFKVMYVTGDGDYRCTLLKNLYGQNAKEGTSFGLSQEVVSGMHKYKLEKNHTYIACGDFRTEKNLTVFSVMNGSGIDDTIDPSKNIKSFPFTDITEKADYTNGSKEMEYWNQIIEFYRVMNGSFHTVAVDTLDKQTDFFIGASTLLDGRVFSDEEAKMGKKVCVVNEGIAAILDVKVGDSITLNCHFSEDQIKFYSSYDVKKGFSDTNAYEIVGIYTTANPTLDKSIYLPKNSLSVVPSNQKRYALANVKIKNGSIKEYEEAIKSTMIDYLKVDFLDQGYAQTVAPINSMRTNSIFVMLLSFICVMVVLLLFATIHISKKKESVAILTALGTKKSDIHKYLATGTYILAGIGCLLGGILGYFTSASIANMVYRDSVRRYSVDLRYSNLAIGVQKAFVSQIDRSILVSVLIGLLVFIITVIICRIYAAQMIKQTSCFNGNKPRKKRISVGNKVKTRKVKNLVLDISKADQIEKKFKKKYRMIFVLYYSVRSVFRNLYVSGVMVLIPIGSAIFMILFSNVIDHYELSKWEAYENIPVEGYFVTPYGRYINSSQISEEMLEKVGKSKNVERSYKSLSYKYEYIGKLDKDLDKDVFEQKMQELVEKEYMELAMPKTSFGLDHKLSEFLNCYEIVQTDNISRTKEFFGAVSPKIDFSVGYEGMYDEEDSDFLKRENADVINVLLNRRFMEENGIKEGDSIVIGAIRIYYDDLTSQTTYDHMPIRCKVVGKFNSVSDKNNIYTNMDLNAQNEHDFINYRLKETHNLKHLRDMLAEQGLQSVGYIGDVRVSFIIQDKELVSTIESIDNNIMFMTLLRYILFGLIVVISFISAYLSMRIRQKEVAIIRSMGTGRMRTFLMFFLEQNLITLCGVAVGTLLACLYIGSVSTSLILMMVGLYICYMLGSGLCIMKMNQTNVLETLSVAE